MAAVAAAGAMPRQLARRMRACAAAAATLFILLLATAATLGAAAAFACSRRQPVPVPPSRPGQALVVQLPARLAWPRRHSGGGLVWGPPPSSTACHAVADPPVRTRPPDVAADIGTRAAEWTECLINDPSADALRVETWVFRTSDYGDFERLLKLRGFQLVGQAATLTCRERQIDPDVVCAECVRLIRGGYYGNLGVSVPAYPPQKEALGCLALSKEMDMPAPSTEEDDSGDWDGDHGRQTAFCNSVNARFDKVDAA